MKNLNAEEMSTMDFENIVAASNTKTGRKKLVLFNILMPKNNNLFTKVLVVHETHQSTNGKYKQTVREVCYNGKDFGAGVRKYNELI